VILWFVVAAPFAGAAAAQLVRGAPGRQQQVATGAAGVVAAASVALAAEVYRGGVERVRVSGPASWELVLVADGLGAAMVATTGATGLFVALFARAHQRLEPRPEDADYWPLLLLLWGAVQALFVAADLFTLYLLLELVAIAGVSLVVLGGGRAELAAGTRYFFAEFAASATFLFGVALVWADSGTVVLADMPAGVAEDGAGALGLALLTVGLLLKVPLAPLHFWLPAAHARAPGAVSPFLSALVVKTAFVVFLRLWFSALAPGSGGVAVAHLLGVLGAVAVVWGSVNALRAGPLKELVAHSTVAQLGYMFLLPPMVLAGSSDAWVGGIVHAVAHALAKAAALMAVVVLVRAAAGPTVADLGGIAARRPVATFAFGVAGLSLVGLPPSGGFVAKWHLLLGAFETGQWWWAPVVVVGSLLTAAYLMRVIKQSFAPLPDGGQPLPERDRRELVALGLALGSLAVGLRPTELIDLVRIGVPL
jgi:multicomponent Na+:H+ antiporter subunit D